MQINLRALPTCEIRLDAPKQTRVAIVRGDEDVEMRYGDGMPAAALSFAQAEAGGDYPAVLTAQVMQAASRLALAAAFALFTGRLVATGRLSMVFLSAVAFAAVLAAISGWWGERAAADAEARVASAIRARIAERLSQLSAALIRERAVGELVVAVERQPAALARLVLSYRASAAMMAIAPAMAVVAVGFVSWQAAVALIVATPLMIVFFVLVGGLVQGRADAQEAALGILASQFADRVRALPTLLANHALAAESLKLDQRLRAHARATMGLLSVAFLNAGIIDFFASLSIAILAVFLGLGHLRLVALPGFDHLRLWQSLFVLMLAAEYFGPFRRHAEQYHAKAEGEAAAAALEWLFVERPMGTPAARRVPVGPLVEAQRPLPALGLVAVTGPSGAGKSTFLRHLAGLEVRPMAGMPARLSSAVAWVSTSVFVPSGRLGDAIAWGRARRSIAGVHAVAEAAGLLDDPNLPMALDTRLSGGGATLSGGQRMRLAVARALLSDRPILADEPTAKLDAASAERVRSALTAAAARRLVVVATHDPALIDDADRVIALAWPAAAGIGDAA